MCTGGLKPTLKSKPTDHSTWSNSDPCRDTPVDSYRPHKENIEETRLERRRAQRPWLVLCRFDNEPNDFGKSRVHADLDRNRDSQYRQSSVGAATVPRRAYLRAYQQATNFTSGKPGVH